MNDFLIFLIFLIFFKIKISYFFNFFSILKYFSINIIINLIKFLFSKVFFYYFLLIFNYFQDYLKDEMSGNAFSEMWDFVKEDEGWEE